MGIRAGLFRGIILWGGAQYDRNDFAKDRYCFFNRIEMGIMDVVMDPKAGVWNDKAVSGVICLGGQIGTGNDRGSRKEVGGDDKDKRQSERIGAVYQAAEKGCLFLCVQGAKVMFA